MNRLTLCCISQVRVEIDSSNAVLLQIHVGICMTKIIKITLFDKVIVEAERLQCLLPRSAQIKKL